MRWVAVDPSGHWFWKTSTQGVKHRRIDHDGQAYWSWKPPAPPRAPRALLNVARLLLEQDHGPFPPRTRFFNTCGLVQCVNPDHWQALRKLPIYHLLEGPDGWQVHLVRTTRPVPHPVIVRARVADAVHVCSLPSEPFHQAVTLCGQNVYPADLVILPTGSLVTCKAGC